VNHPHIPRDNDPPRMIAYSQYVKDTNAHYTCTLIVICLLVFSVLLNIGLAFAWVSK
jgi:hypothetical protein